MATTAAMLSGDLLREIFLQLSSAEVLMCAVLTCKAWQRAIRDASFLRRFHALHPLPHTIGFLFTPSPSAVHPTGFFFEPAASYWSDAIAARDFSLSFLPGSGASSHDLRIVACHNGRILLRNMVTEEFMVADPLSRRYFRIPQPPADLTTMIFYFLVRNFLIYRESDQSFQVLRFVQPPPSMRVGIFSSGTGTWRCLQLENSILILLGRISLDRYVHIKQSLYWITASREHMVEFDTTTMEFSQTSLPADLCDGLPRYACAVDQDEILQEGALVVYPVSTEDGRVGVFVAMWNMSYVKLWIRQEGGGSGGLAVGWVLEKEVMLQEEMRRITECSSNVWLSVVGASRGMVFFAKWGYKNERSEASYVIFMSLRLKSMDLKMIRVIESTALRDGFQPYETMQPPPLLDPDRQSDNILDENP